MVVFGLAWELVSRSNVLPREYVPPISEILIQLTVELQKPVVWLAIKDTTTAWATGLALVLLIGIPTGLALGSSRLAYRLSNVSVEYLRTIPSIAAIPLLILIYGSGQQLSITMVVFGAIWPVIIQTMYGVQDVDPVAKEMARAYGLGTAQQFLRVVLPGASAYIATGIRLAAVMSLILAVSASLLAGGRGLGALIASASASAATTSMFARTLLAGFLGLAVTLLFTHLERRLLHWHPSQRAVQK